MNEFYQASDLDFLLKKETAVLEGLVGRDKCGNIFLYPTMPFRGKDEWQEKYQEYIDVQKRLPHLSRATSPSDLDFLPEKETAVLEGFVARDKSGFISLFSYRPDRITKGNLGFWGRSDGFAEIGLPRDSFPSVTWLSEPKRIRITIETIDE